MTVRVRPSNVWKGRGLPPAITGRKVRSGFSFETLLASAQAVRNTE